MTSRASMLATLCLSTSTSLATTACGAPCRDAQFRALPLACSDTTTFDGDLHFDRRATFDTFLSQCLPTADADARAAIADQVDFRHEAVFVSVGARLDGPDRCIAERGADHVEVCGDGLKVSFRDQVRGTQPDPCNGVWTAALIVGRGDLRAALGDVPTGTNPVSEQSGDRSR